MSGVRRWNVEMDDDGALRVCAGDHERSGDCEWTRYVRESRLTALTDQHAREVEGLRGVAAKFTEADVLRLTQGRMDHPEGWEGPCHCDECLSYASDDGEG